MKKFYKIIIVFIVAFFVSMNLTGCQGVSPNYDKYNSLLQTQMREMYNVLFGGHAREFMQTYVDPGYIQSMGGLDQAMLQFGNARQQLVMKALRVGQNIEPFYEQGSNTMIYQSAVLPEPLVFKLETGKWYLQSDYFKD